MPLHLDNFVALRPYLYHLTARENLSRIASSGRLESAATLMRAAGDTRYLRDKRKGHHAVQIDGERVMIRDQAPFFEKNARFDEGFSAQDFLQLVNERVFFWPGTADNPVVCGVNHFKRYKDESIAILRMKTADVLAIAHNPTPQLCKYNSGAPRCSPTTGHSPRGSNTFVEAKGAMFLPSEVTEVTFVGGVSLPEAGVECTRNLSDCEWLAFDKA